VRKLVLLSLLLLPILTWGQNLGVFTNSGDVGDPRNKGSVEFDAAKGEYRITGSGANIWAKDDQFQYVWKECPVTYRHGHDAVSGSGEDHRKAGIMVRQSLDNDSSYGDFVIHGNGMPGLQWRSTKATSQTPSIFLLTGQGNSESNWFERCRHYRVRR